MYDIVTALRRSPVVLDVDVLELIDEDSVRLIKIKATLKKAWVKGKAVRGFQASTHRSKDTRG